MKQHPLCTDCEQSASVMDLPIPAGLKREWASIETRRRFLGRSGKVLGWAAMASLSGEAALRGDVHGTTPSSAPKLAPRDQLKLPHFAPKAKRAIYLFMSGGPPRSICSITSRTWPRFSTRTCPTRCAATSN